MKGNKHGRYIHERTCVRTVHQKEHTHGGGIRTERIYKRKGHTYRSGHTNGVDIPGIRLKEYTHGGDMEKTYTWRNINIDDIHMREHVYGQRIEGIYIWRDARRGHTYIRKGHNINAEGHTHGVTYMQAIYTQRGVTPTLAQGTHVSYLLQELVGACA